MAFDLHDTSHWSLPLVLEKRAGDAAEKVFITMVGGEALTYRELRDDAALVAGMLHYRGVSAGDRVGLLLPNDLDFARAWCGVGRLGAVAVLLNTELTGLFLAHPLRDSAARTLIVHIDLLPGLIDLPDMASVERVIVVGGHASLPDVTVEAFDTWRDAEPFNGAFPQPSDLACIMYTSGTTGAPKGVLMPHAHCYLFALGVVDNVRLAATDHYYVCLPLFHANGLLMQFSAAMLSSASITLRARFSASAWLNDIRDSGATVTNSLGAISAFVMAQPPRERDREHRLRAILSAPNHPNHDRDWRERFGVEDVLGAYGMTEVNIPLYGELGIRRPGTCGKPYSRYFEVQIRDANFDVELPRETVGEIMVRPRVPFGFMAGYNGLPEKTVEACRNFWFHTGDAGRMDGDGYVTFVDRIKDCIRRRGENISAADVEASFAELPGIAEIAAYAVPSGMEGGEDEIMLAIVLRSGSTVSPAEIIEHARLRIPRFAQPRFLVTLDHLPKTSSEKVRKVELRQAGITPDTIDLLLVDSPSGQLDPVSTTELGA